MLELHSLKNLWCNDYQQVKFIRKLAALSPLNLSVGGF